MHVHPTSCRVSCAQSSSILGFKHALHGQTFHLPHRTTVAIENSLEHLNDKSLFGSLKTDQNLIEEGNIVLGSDLDNSANNHEDEIVFHEPIPVTNGIDDELMMMVKSPMMTQYRHQVIQPCHLDAR